MIRIQGPSHVLDRQVGERVLKVCTDIIFYLISLGLVVSSIFYAVNANPKKSLFGYRVFSVLTDSMTPNCQTRSGGFSKGDLIVVEAVAPSEIEVGDIVTYMPGRDSTSYLTHRVVDIRENINGQITFVTRGDSNHTDDSPFQSEKLIGKKVLSIPRIGGFLRLLHDHIVVVAVAVIAGILLISALRLRITRKSNCF